MPNVPSPVRSLSADVHTDDLVIRTVSAALPPGSMWGRTAKRAQGQAPLDHLVAVAHPVIVGMDRNGPKVERWSTADTEWWPEDDPHLFARLAEKGFADILEVFHAQDGAAKADARAARPHGPRAVSYIERRANPPFPRRYDVILASDDVAVRDVSYHFEDSTRAGSDHALVLARLSLPTEASRP